MYQMYQKYQDNYEPPSQEAVEAWLDFVDGEFHYTTACDSRYRKEDWVYLRNIIRRCVGKNLIESVGRKDGLYRKVSNHAKPVDWQGYQKRRDSGLILPFDLRKYVFIYPDTEVIVAGSKSSGKTGFLYRTVALNMYRKDTKVVLLTNLEGGIGMLKDRFDAMDIQIPVPAPFVVLQVSDNFHDYIKDVNTTYIIDYIDAPEGTDFYLIGAQVKKIDQKLQGLNSNAVIGLQKPTTRDTAFGGEQTLKTATLYLAIDNKKLKIVDAKVPADKKVHPKNMQFTFGYDNEGTNFTDIMPWYGEE